MLEKSDTSISSALQHFNSYELDVGLLVPTETGMKKSIMDATASVRDFFKDTGIHDYGAQPQGPENKVTKRAFLVHPDRLVETKASLYRPNTKNGDPRVWFYGLGEYADPFNLLALLARDDAIYIVNCSKEPVIASIADPATPLGDLAAKARPDEDAAGIELLDMLRQVASKGYVQTFRPGDTGIGMTLETLLGISANSNKAPDYKGIEIKAKRLRKAKPNRVTLFSQVPNWKLSPIGTAWNLLSTYGYHRHGKLRLNHEMNAVSPNSIGFVLEVDAARDWLKQNHVDPETTSSKHVATWELEHLRGRLAEKHPQTFWVGAKCRGRGEDEQFHYVQVEHTKRPKVRNFDALLEGGLITVDYLMSQKGENRVRDHGYLFKIHPSDFEALFPPSKFHVLC
jgi:hypothetical protein